MGRVLLSFAILGTTKTFELSTLLSRRRRNWVVLWPLWRGKYCPMDRRPPRREA
jgi:hypothetical protein